MYELGRKPDIGGGAHGDGRCQAFIGTRNTQPVARLLCGRLALRPTQRAGRSQFDSRFSSPAVDDAVGHTLELYRTKPVRAFVAAPGSFHCLQSNLKQHTDRQVSDAAPVVQFGASVTTLRWTDHRRTTEPKSWNSSPAMSAAS